MSNKAAYIKTIIVSSAIFGETFFLTQALINYFETVGYFSFDFNLLSTIGILVLALTYTVSLSSPAWGEWTQLAIVSFPFTVAVYVNLFPLEPANALVIAGIIFVVLSFFVERSLKLENVLAKNIPSVFLRPAIRGLLLSISIVAAGIVLLNPKDNTATITEGIEELTKNNVGRMLNKPMEENPELGYFVDYTTIEETVGDEISGQVKTAIEPYRNIINILMSVFILLTMQGFNAIVFVVFSVTVNLLFFIARKTTFVKKETVMIEKEILKF